MALFKLIPVDRCELEAGRYVEAAGHELAVFRLSDPERFVVIDNACPHSSGNLSAGEVCGNVVTCPLHQWKFDLDRCVCVDSEKARVRQYDVEIRDGWIQVELPGVSSD